MGTDVTAGTITDELLHRIRGEYTEMPGLRVTQAQAQRLWGLDEVACRVALDSLVAAGFLRRTDSGQYARLTEGASSSPTVRMMKAELGATPSRQRIAI
jgi:hypothetical protein